MIAGSLLGIDAWLVAFCLFVVFAGAALQASIGIGLGLVAAPLLGLVDTDFIPGALAVSVVPLVVGMTIREHHGIDRPGLIAAVVGRAPGVLLGAWVAAAAGHRAIALVIGVAVLIAVIGSLTGIHFPPTQRNLVVAGAVSGFTGTAAGVGGPPMALTYQHADPVRLRGTLAAYNSIGSVMTITSLIVAGVLGTREFQLAMMLVPGVVVGLLASKYTAARLPAEKLRPAVLAVCSCSALVLLIEELA